MYEALIAHLRECAKLDKSGNTYKEAADAIEQLSRDIETERSAIRALDALFQNTVKQVPRWIPAEERLPDILHTVIISGRMKYEWEIDYTQFVDVATYTEGEFFETFNDWYEGQHEFGITHWMPLPLPPKENEHGL